MSDDKNKEMDYLTLLDCIEKNAPSLSPSQITHIQIMLDETYYTLYGDTLYGVNLTTPVRPTWWRIKEKLRSLFCGSN